VTPMPDNDTNMSYVSDVLLRRLAEQLAAQGMEIRECPHGCEIVEIAITNPYDLDRGRVVMGMTDSLPGSFGPHSGSTAT
jgi:hypothetical protein